MAAQIRLVDKSDPILGQGPTKVITTYANGEVLARIEGPRVEGERATAAPHGLLIEGVAAETIAAVAARPRPESPEPGLAYVVLAGPVQAEWLTGLRAVGVEPMRFHPRSAYLAKATPDAFDRAARLDFVVQVVPLVPEFKTAPVVAEQGGQKVWIVTTADGDAARLARVPGVEIETEARPAAGLTRVPAVIEGRALTEILALPFVLAVEDRVPVVPEDEVAGLILAGSYDRQGRPAGDYQDWLDDHAVNGSGVTIGIVDNGVDESHEAFSGRITARDSGRAWHGTFVAGHAAGCYLEERDGEGFLYGLGTAPAAEIISQDNSAAAAEACGETVSTAGPSGALGTIQNNSWGVGTQNPMDYRSLEASYDALVRNASPAGSEARPLTICFSSGNSGADGLTRPKAAKNIIVTGNSESYRPTVGGSESDNINHLFTGSHGSSYGNCGDGRVRPDLVAPGEWTASANFDSLPGQAEFISPKLTWGGGSSGASPKTAGCCALLTQWWRDRNAGATPSPALLRAMLVNGAEDMGFGGPIPNNRQGWGRLNLANVLSDDVHHVYVDQTSLLAHRGETRSWRLRVSDPDMPVRVTLAWTDPPGPVNSGTATVPAIVNALGLTVECDGRSYAGNNFVNGFSISGPLDDPARAGMDNLQNVYIAPGEATSPFVVSIAALNITTDCLTGEATDPKQDFALVVTNGYVDAGFVPSDLFMQVDDTSRGAGASIDDVVIDDGDGPDVAERPTLRIGARGEDVRFLQGRLAARGFYSGVVDGIFGTGTMRATQAFQRSAGLVADGVVGPATWGALAGEEAVRKPVARRASGNQGLLEVAARGLRSAATETKLARGPATEAGGTPPLGEALARLMARFEEWLADGRRKAALIVVGGETRVTKDDLRALRRLAMHGDLYLVGTEEAVLLGLAQEINLPRSVHPRLAAPNGIEAAVRAAAAEIAGCQQLVLRRTASADEGRGLVLDLGFDLTGADQKASIEIEGTRATEMLVTPPGGGALRLTLGSRRKGMKLMAEGERLTLELEPAGGKAWAGAWQLRLDDPSIEREPAVLGYASPGPALRLRQSKRSAAQVLVTARGENGVGITRLAIRPVATSGVASESQRRDLEILAKPRRLDGIGSERARVESGPARPVPSLDAILRLGGGAEEPAMMALRVTIEGQTAEGEVFARMLDFTPMSLVSPRVWRKRPARSLRIVEARLRSVRDDGAGRIMAMSLEGADGKAFEARVTDAEFGARLSRLEPREGTQHFVLEGMELVRVLRLLPARASGEGRR